MSTSLGEAGDAVQMVGWMNFHAALSSLDSGMAPSPSSDRLVHDQNPMSDLSLSNRAVVLVETHASAGIRQRLVHDHSYRGYGWDASPPS